MAGRSNRERDERRDDRAMADDGPIVAFFLGKGGTGKTTACLAMGLAAARSHLRVQAVSLDMAHNLLDLAGFESGPGRHRTIDGLALVEPDLDAILNQEVARVQRQVEAGYAHLHSLGLGRLFKLLGRSPGLAETSVASYLWKLRRDLRDKVDLLLVDMPPTATAMRILAMPELNIGWLEGLVDLRRRILDLRGAIARAKGQDVTQDGADRNAGGEATPERVGTQTVSEQARMQALAEEAGAGSSVIGDRVMDRMAELVEQNRRLASWIEQKGRTVVLAGGADVTVREAALVAKAFAPDLLLWNRQRFSGALPKVLAKVPQLDFVGLGDEPGLDDLAQAGTPLLDVLVGPGSSFHESNGEP